MDKLLEYRQSLIKNMTQAEQRLYEKLKELVFQDQCKYRFNLIIRQAVIGWYIVDFLLPHKHLVIELDGNQHLKHDNKVDDIIRDDYLHSLGLDVVRYANQEIFENIESVISDIGLWASLESKVSNFFKVKSNIKKQEILKGNGKLVRPSKSYDL